MCTRKASESFPGDRDFIFTVDKRALVWCIRCTKNAENYGKILLLEFFGGKIYEKGRAIKLGLAIKNRTIINS
jgi:hypothetical protein